MRNLKKVIALIAVFAMVLTTSAFAASFPDVEAGSAAAEAISTLADLSILKGDENGNYNPDAVVTRAEMAAIIARIQGYEGDIAASATNFNDVPSTHWASGYVALAAGQGIVNGYGNGMFGPDDTVKYEEAIKMVMVTLGYEPMAADQGGYPAGYIAAANSQRVLSGVTGGVTGQGCARSTIAQLIYNAIDTPLMIRTGYGTNTSYEVTGSGSDYDRQTLMSERLDITKLKGFVLANEVTSLMDGDTVNVNTDDIPTIKVRVNGNYKNTGSDKYGDISSKNTEIMTFRIGNSDASAYLGKQVVFYVQEDNYNDDDVVLSITEETSKNNEVTFTLDQYDSAVFDGSALKTIKYRKNATDRNTSNLNIQASTSANPVYVVYNGLSASYSDLKSKFFDGSDPFVAVDSPVSGKVTVLDTDSVSGNDVIMIEISATAVVDKVTASRVTFKATAGSQKYNNNLKTIDFDDEATDFICNITKDGKPIEYTELKEWDVLSIITNNDASGDVYTIRVVSNQIDGSVASTKSSKTSKDGKSYRIDGKDYDLALGAYGVDSLKAGSAGMFYIDEYGKIAAFDKNGGTQANRVASDNYAFILAASDTSSDFGDSGISVKVLSSKKGVGEISFASSVTVDEAGARATLKFDNDNVKISGDKTSLFGDATSMKAGKVAEKFENQVIRFGTSSEGKINNIEIAVENEADGVTEGDFRFVASTTKDGSFDEDDQEVRIGNSSYPVNEDTKVLYVNGASSKTEDCVKPTKLEMNNFVLSKKADADKSSVGTGAELAETTGMACAVFDTDNNDVPALVVIFDVDGMISPSTSMAVIVSVSDSVNDEGDRINVVEYYQDGKLTTANTTEDVKSEGVLDNAKRGDVYKFALDASGNIKKATAKVTFSAVGDNVRAKITGTNNAPTVGVPTVTNDADDMDATEYYYAGPVVGYTSSGSLKVAVADKNGKYDTVSKRVGEAGVYVYDPELRESNRLFVGDDSYLDVVDEDLAEAPNAGYVRKVLVDSSNNSPVFVTGTPAYGMLGFAVVRVYDGKIAEVLYVSPFDYKGYYVSTVKEDDPVAVTGVSLDKTTAEVAVGATVALTATVAPSTATNKNVTWASSDTAKATVDDKGVVTGVAEGSVDITVTTADGSKTAKCTVTVAAAATGE